MARVTKAVLEVLLKDAQDTAKTVADALCEAVTHINCGSCPIVNDCAANDEGYNGVCIVPGDLVTYFLENASKPK